MTRDQGLLLYTPCTLCLPLHLSPYNYGVELGLIVLWS